MLRSCLRALAPTAGVRRARCLSGVASPPPPPPPPAAAAAPAGGLSGLAARSLALAREYGPAGAAVWTALYVAPALAAYAHLRAHENNGFTLAGAVAAVPEGAARAWVESALAAGGAAVAAAGLDVGAAAEPWHTSVALAWAATEAAEPLRLAATLLALRAWRRRKAARAAQAAGATEGHTGGTRG